MTQIGDDVNMNWSFTAILMILEKKAGNGFNMAASCHWDPKKDGSWCKKYTFEQYHVILTVYCFQK